MIALTVGSTKFSFTAIWSWTFRRSAATAEISRAQLWQWIHLQATLDDGRPVDRQLYETARADALAEIRAVQ